MWVPMRIWAWAASSTAAIVDHDAVLGRGVHVAPGGIVKAGAEVEALTKVDSGEIIKK